ncbi:MAG: hypothetical protein AAF903_04545 [Pseudomonadota bacterium]
MSSSLQMFARSLLAMTIFFSVPDLQAASKSRAKDSLPQFEANFDAFSAKNPVAADWLKQDSPWSPLLRRQFSDALDEAERKRSETAQRFGQCEFVVSGELQGLISLHPHLQAIMLRADIRENFETVLLPQFSSALRRCRAFEKLIPIIETTRRRYGLDETFAVALPQISVFPPSPFGTSSTGLNYGDAVSEIYTLGLCLRFKPALQDIVWLETEIRTHQIPLESLEWFADQFPEASPTRQKLEIWRDYIADLKGSGDQSGIVKRIKPQSGEINSLQQTPRLVHDFCKNTNIKMTDNH